jgi:hypothetical protein
MYRLGEREHHHRKLYITLGIFAVIIVAGIIFAKQFLSSDTKIDNSAPAAVTAVTYEQTKLQQVDVPHFTMSIPATWKVSTINAEEPKPTYIWQGTTGEDKNRWISVFVDKPLTAFAVNRALHIQSNGATITVIGSTSDNCTSFTGPANTQTGKTPAKWETIDFLCDSGNYQRDVVGIVSPDGLNNVDITGTAKGTHRYFFTFTDNTNQPDYSIFTSALRSLKAK